jgi:uncharacterized protein YkvS
MYLEIEKRKYIMNTVNQDIDQVVERTRQWNIVQDAICAIRDIDNIEDLNSVIKMAIRQKELMAQQKIKSLSVGNIVSFTNGDGTKVKGIVEKINRKNVIVNDGTRGKWRVPATMIQLAEA